MNNVIKQITDYINSAPANMEVLDWIFGEQKQSALTGAPVVLFGTGHLGKDLLKTLVNHGITPVCFCNSDPTKSGSLYCDLPVISIDDLKALHKSSLIVVATQTHAASVKKHLLDIGFCRERVLWPKDFDMLFGLYFSYANQSVLRALRVRTSQDLINVLTKNQEKISAVHSMLTDKKSKELFIAKLAFLVCNENLGLFKNLMLNFSEPICEFGLIPFPNLGPENYFYFNNDVFSLSQKEVFVDVGAFDGDSVTTFVQACNKHNLEYKHIYAFEPDPRNYQALEKNTADFKNLSLHKVGIWSRPEVLRFESSEKSFSNTASGIAKNGDIEVQVVSLDDFLKGKAASIIKMDPPGNIIPEALMGAKKTISKFKPKLVLNAYNTFEDIFEMPFLINTIWPDYKLYLRHISWTVCETDLFAMV